MFDENTIFNFYGEYRFLSNFYASPFMGFSQNLQELVPFKTVEHFYQSEKCQYLEDSLRIIKCVSPKEAKHYGKHVKLIDNWEMHKKNVMFLGLSYKFNISYLRDRLIKTYPKKLVEGNYWGDVYWGVDLKTGKGQNVLGKLLMEIREDIMNQYSV